MIEKPQEEWIITKDTQPPIVDEETWQSVQRIRENGKRRYTSRGEMGPLNGLIYCSDCGAKLHVARAQAIKPESEYYSCSRYKNKLTGCTSHRINRMALERLVLEDLQRVTAFAKEREAEFTALVESQMRKVEELTGEIAATFIDRIIVGPLERVDGKKHQTVRILYNIVGQVAGELESRK